MEPLVPQITAGNCRHGQPTALIQYKVVNSTRRNFSSMSDIALHDLQAIEGS